MAHRKIHAHCWQCGNNRDIIVLAAKQYRAAARRIVLNYRSDIRNARQDTIDDPLTDPGGASSTCGSLIVDALARKLTDALQASAEARIRIKAACIAADQALDVVDEGERALIYANTVRSKATARLEKAKADLMKTPAH